MGKIFELTEKYLPAATDNSVFVEIGSDRWEGSTKYFADLAIKHNTVLHTVDIDSDPQRRHHTMSGVVWHCTIGSVWAVNNFPILDKKITCLYLDNFDYDWETKKTSQMIEDQKILYRDRFNLLMSNQNSQLEHMKQMLALYPYMNEHSIVVCDDTYTYNDCWIGKSGPVVVFLLANGYTIQKTTTDCGVILKR